MRLRRWIENLLLLAGLVAIDIWIWSHAALACRERARVLPAAINSQELAVFPRHPDDERLPVYVYPVVEVGDPSTQRRDRDGGAGPLWNPTDDFV